MRLMHRVSLFYSHTCSLLQFSQLSQLSKGSNPEAPDPSVWWWRGREDKKKTSERDPRGATHSISSQQYNAASKGNPRGTEDSSRSNISKYEEENTGRDPRREERRIRLVVRNIRQRANEPPERRKVRMARTTMNVKERRAKETLEARYFRPVQNRKCEKTRRGKRGKNRVSQNDLQLQETSA